VGFGQIQLDVIQDGRASLNLLLLLLCYFPKLPDASANLLKARVKALVTSLEL
jgi:hypothetical protein